MTTTAPSEQPTLLTAPQVAKRLDVSDETVRRWVKKGQIPHIKLPSGHTRFREEDIAELLRPTAANAGDEIPS